MPKKEQEQGIPVKVIRVISAPMEVELDDGTHLSLHFGITAVHRAQGEWSPDGSPHYNIEVGVGTKITAPTELMKPGS